LNPFRPIPHEQLNDLSDEDLIAYVLAARATNAIAEARAAIQILVYGYRKDIARKVRLRMKEHAVDEVADMALIRAVAVKTPFTGESVGQFRSWLWTIVDRTIADWYRAAERRPQETALPEEHEGNEGVWGPVFAVEHDLTEGIHARACFERVMNTLNDNHRRIIELYLLEDGDARCTAEETGASEANVYQVAKRFKTALRRCLEEDGDTSLGNNG
jgi:RNA polymerase sigma factor (sigma-70 family)